MITPTLQTDRQTTCDRNTALCTKVHRAVNTAVTKSCAEGGTSELLRGTIYDGARPRNLEGTLTASRSDHVQDNDADPQSETRLMIDRVTQNTIRCKLGENTSVTFCYIFGNDFDGNEGNHRRIWTL